MDITFNNYTECVKVYNELEKERIQIEHVNLYNEMNSFINNNIVELDYDSELYTEEVSNKKQKWYEKLWEWIKKVWAKIVTFFVGDKSLIKKQAKEIEDHKEEIEKNSSSSEYISSHSSEISSSLGNISSTINQTNTPIDKKAEIINGLNELIKKLKNKQLINSTQNDLNIFTKCTHEIFTFNCMTITSVAESIVNLFQKFEIVNEGIKEIISKNSLSIDEIKDNLIKPYYFYSCYLAMCANSLNLLNKSLFNASVYIFGASSSKQQIMNFMSNQNIDINSLDKTKSFQLSINLFEKYSSIKDPVESILNQIDKFIKSIADNLINKIINFMSQGGVTKTFNDIQDSQLNHIQSSTNISLLNISNQLNTKKYDFKDFNDMPKIPLIPPSTAGSKISTGKKLIGNNDLLKEIKPVLSDTDLDYFINFFQKQFGFVEKSIIDFMDFGKKVKDLYDQFYNP